MNILPKNSWLPLMIIGVLCFVQQALAQKNAPTKIDNYLQQAHKSGLFNGNVLVAEHNKIILKTAIGYADASKQIQLSVQYRFHIGSVAKEFDAVGIMLLQEQGKLSVNDKLSKFFSGSSSMGR